MSRPLVSCIAKHTKYQPSDKEWLCPKCSSGSKSPEPFIITDTDEGALVACPALHERDSVYCEHCGLTASGKTVAAKMQAKASMISCPKCRGTGFVKG
jgi:Zn finger protein HypA/HybF involved in hydrogenase expression